MPRNGYVNLYLFILITLLTVTAGSCSRGLLAPDLTWERQTAAPTISLGNLHMHTTCSDGQNTYEEMVQMALRLGFSFIAVTDHKFGGTPLCEAVLSQCREEKRLLCIPGMEVTGRVHLLAVGIHSGIDHNLPVKEQVAEIHKQGGLAIAAHPFREGNVFSEEELFESNLDGIECRGIPLLKRRWFFRRLQESNIPCLYNSDAHSAIELLIRWNSCEGEIKSLSELKKALKEKRCSRW